MTMTPYPPQGFHWYICIRGQMPIITENGDYLQLATIRMEGPFLILLVFDPESRVLESPPKVYDWQVETNNCLMTIKYIYGFKRK
jgi:hypothetical protein